VRKVLKQFFKNRSCVPLIRPSDDERDLQELKYSNQSLIKPEFKKQLDELKLLICNQIKPKALDGVCLSGPEFV
jgi:hypothetical protein